MVGGVSGGDGRNDRLWGVPYRICDSGGVLTKQTGP